MKKHYLYLLLFTFLNLSLLLNFVSCTNPTTPPDSNGVDTTSHNFTWQTFTFGQHSSSTLYDVAIINENNIWAVGEIYMNRPDGTPEPDYYNAAHWSGSQWELKKIGGYGGYPRRTVFAFAENDVWFDGVIKWDGANYTVHKNGWPLMPNGDGWIVNKMWGSSSNDLYAVGNGGNIAHYNGQRWSKIESGTEVDLTDIWGDTSGTKVWVAGFDDVYGTVLLRSKENVFEKVLEITDPNLPHPPNQITHVFRSLWTDKIDTVYLGAIGRIYAAPQNTSGYGKENIWWDYQNQQGYPPETRIIRGTASNDIFIGGYLNFIRHFNGKSWKNYPEIKSDGSWFGMAVNKNIVVAVGETNNYPNSARIVIGRRPN